MKNLILLLALVGLVAACSPATVDTKAEGEKLMQISREWSQAAGAGDIEKVLSYWSDDAILYSAGEPVRKGKAEIRKMVEGSMKDPGFKISWEPLQAEVSASGDLGYLLEETTISMTDSTGQSMVMLINGITIWKKTDGTWKNVVDVVSPKAGNP